MPKSSIVFAAAGSGGHVFAAIATLKAFQSDFPTLSKDLVFVGSTLTMEGEIRQLPMEERICNRLGIPFRKIRMGKVQRTISVNSLKLLARIVVGFWDAWKLLRELKPSVVVAFGGYVSFPLVIVGKLLGAKIVIHEQTSSIGLTNKILQYWADVIVLTYESSLPYFRKKALVLGSPTMKHIYSISDYEHLLGYLKKEKSRLLDETEYLEKLKWLEDQKNTSPILLMSGGSQGSHFLNEQIRPILNKLLQHMIVVIQVGENEYYNDYAKFTEYLKALPAELSQKLIIRKFVYEEFGFLMKKATLFLGRSGANTVYQVGLNGLFAVFVPIPWVTKNEQYTNAMILKARGKADIIDQDRCTSEVLYEVLSDALQKAQADTEKKSLFSTEADRLLAKEIAKLAV